MPQQHPFCRETVTFAVPPESLITVNCSVPAPTGECRGCHLEFCPVAVGLPETACGDSNHPHQQTAVFCIGCFLHSCTICDSPWRFLVARAESLLHLMREDSAFLRAVGESKAVRSHLASCLSRLALNRKADRCSELLCEALALMIMVSAEEIVCDGIWQKLPPEAVVLTLRQVFEISPVATHSAVLAYLVQPDNPQLLTCVDVVARGESGELVVAAASEVVELAVGYVLGKEELESASMWFIDSALCRGLVSRFSRGQRNDTAMRIMLMIAGCQEAVDALFMGVNHVWIFTIQCGNSRALLRKANIYSNTERHSERNRRLRCLDDECDLGTFHSFIHELEAAVEFHVLQSGEEDLQEACIILCKVFLVPTPPIVPSGPRTLSIIEWLLELVRTGSSMGSLAAACLEDYAGACPEIIVKRVWNDDFVPMISPHIGEEPFAALLRTVLEAVEPSSVGDATLNALLRSAEVLLCRGLEGPAATVMNFLIGSVGNGDLGRLSSGISAVLESVEVWESSTVNSDLFFGRICDLIVASAPRLSTVPLVALIDQLSTVFLEHFVSSPVATESFLNAMGVLIGDSYECPRLVELQHRLRSAAVLVSAVTIGSGSVVRLLMLGIVPRWLVPLLSVEDVGVTAGELFTRAVELDGGASSLTGLTALFSWLTSDGVVANNLLAAAEPLSKLIVSEWEPRMLTEALLLVSHVLRLLATRGCYRPASQVKARVLSAFSIAHLDEWKPDADAASHHVKHITLTLAWLLEECEEVPVEIFTLLANAVTVADSNLEVGSAEFLRAVVVAASQQPQFAESRMLHSAIKLIGTIETFAEDWQAETLLTACCNFLGRGHLGAEECALLCDLVAAVLMMHPVGVAILMDVGVCLEGVAATRLTSTGSLHIPLRESCLQAACVVYELLQAHSATPKCIWLGAWAESETGGSPGAVAFCAMAGIRLPVDGLSSITFTVRCAYWSMTLSSGRSNLNENEISDLLAFGAEGVLMGESSTAVDTECAVTLLSTLLVFARQTRDCLAISLILACLLSEPPIGLPYSCLVLALVRYRPVWYRLDPDCLLGHLCIVADSLEQLPGDHRRRFGEALVKWASDLLSPRHVAAINESSRLPPVVAHAPRRHGKDWDTWVMTGMIHRACDLIMKKLI